MRTGAREYARMISELCVRCRRGEPVTDVLCDLGGLLLFRRVAIVGVTLLLGKARRLPTRSFKGTTKKGR